MIRKATPLAILVGVLGATATAHAQKPARGDIHVYLGQKFFSEEEWGPIDPKGIGIHAMLAAPNSYGGIALDVSYMADDEQFNTFGIPVTLEQSLIEARIGPRAAIRANNIVFYAGTGLSVIYGRHSIESPDDRVVEQHESDKDVGLWLGGGVVARFDDRYDIGVTATYTVGRNLEWCPRITDPCLVRDPSGIEAGIVIGYAFPSQ